MRSTLCVALTSGGKWRASRPTDARVFYPSWRSSCGTKLQSTLAPFYPKVATRTPDLTSCLTFGACKEVICPVRTPSIIFVVATALYIPFRTPLTPRSPFITLEPSVSASFAPYSILKVNIPPKTVHCGRETAALKRI